MGLFDRVERKLESAVNGAFARAFRAEVQPVEIASAMRRAMDDRAAVVGKGRTVVPNLFVVDLSPTDYERLTSYAELLADELVASVAEHAEQQRYVPGGPFHIDFRSREDLETGVFRVRPATAKRIPASEAPDHRAEAERRRVEHAEELRRAHPFRHSEAEAPAEGAAGLASHAASAAAGSLASTAAAARAGGAGPYARPGQAADPQAHGHAAPHADALSAPPADPPADALAPPAEAPTPPPQGPPEPRAHPAEPAPPAHIPPPPHTPPAAEPAGAPEPTRAPAHPPAYPSPVDAAERPWLECDGDHYPLLGALTVLGRDPSADITLEDAGISRRHVEVRVTHDGPHFAITVRDLGSTNGTFVNGDRITSRRVTDGDRLTIGRTSLAIRVGRR